MKRIRWSTIRWTATALTLIAVVLAYVRRADASNYYVETNAVVSTANCYYDLNGNKIYAGGWGKTSTTGLCDAEIDSSIGGTAYAYCGTTQPTTTEADCYYLGSTGFISWNTATTTTWTNTATASISPAHHSDGTTCGPTTYIDCEAYGVTY
jgi:hypothetical protein